MLTNLSGNTAKWAQPLNQRVLNKSDPDVTPLTLAKFITSFKSYFLEPEHKGKAQKALCNLKSGNRQYPREPLPWWIGGEHPTCNRVIRHAPRQQT
ncbi:hypothetical protein VP01_1658g7 [Puccinia sorghi]|uniref:Retrotransposon gag domain-containing protein n=1 Tax=Puccinia sorghi TaxID=27349 RepID=A0A0L6VGY0_9BASI|nr:hypothetical protein VP01_1658g7 [Puccinia sorghi]